MFGGILEITKETEDFYVFNINSKKWFKIDVNQGPINLDSY